MSTTNQGIYIMKVEIEIAPFAIPPALMEVPTPATEAPYSPGGVSRQIQFNEVSPEDLGKLCDDFKRAVFDKAGYKVPGGLDVGAKAYRNVSEGVVIHELDSHNDALVLHLVEPYRCIKVNFVTKRAELDGYLLAYVAQGVIQEFTVAENYVDIMSPAGTVYRVAP